MNNRDLAWMIAGFVYAKDEEGQLKNHSINLAESIRDEKQKEMKEDDRKQ